MGGVRAKLLSKLFDINFDSSYITPLVFSYGTAFIAIVGLLRCFAILRIICRKIRWEGVDLIYLVQDIDQWLAFVNTVMNFWVPYIGRSFLCG
jgi:hypothetical protein